MSQDDIVSLGLLGRPGVVAGFSVGNALLGLCFVARHFIVIAGGDNDYGNACDHEREACQ